MYLAQRIIINWNIETVNIVKMKSDIDRIAEYVNSTQINNQKHQPLINAQILRDLTAAIFSIWVGTYIGHPFDTVKVRMQLSHTKESMISLAKKIVRDEGIRGFYKGAWSSLLGQIFIWSSAFVANDFSKRGLSWFNISQNTNNFKNTYFELNILIALLK